MDGLRVDHIALHVDSLRQAENLYTSLFGLPIISREAPTEDGPAIGAAQSWAEIDASGVSPVSSLLGYDNFRLSLYRKALENGEEGRLRHIRLCAAPESAGQLAHKAEELGCLVLQDDPDCLVFQDPYGVQWEIAGQPADECVEILNGRP